MKFQASRWLGAAVIVTAQLGCAGIVRDTTKAVTPAVISGAADGLADPHTQRDLLTITDPSKVKDLTHQVSAGVVDGTLDTLEDPARDKRIEELSNRLVESALASLDTPQHRASINSLVSGIAGSAVGTVIDTTMNRAFDEQNQQKMRTAMRATVGELIGVVFESVHKEMGSSDDREKVLASAAHDITKGATLGFQDAVDEAKHKQQTGEKAKGDDGLLLAAANAPENGKRLLLVAGAGTAALVIGLLVALLWSIRRNNARRAELEQRDEALLLLTEAIKSTETQPWSNELRQVIKKSMRDRDGGDHIRKVLRGKQDLRLRDALA